MSSYVRYGVDMRDDCIMSVVSSGVNCVMTAVIVMSVVSSVVNCMMTAVIVMSVV